MHSKEIEEWSRRLRPSAIQRDVLIGTLLGDGHLETMNQGRTYRLKIEHTITQQDYVSWLYQVFHEWVRTAPVVRSREVTFRGRTKSYKRVGFATLSSGSLRFYAGQFYRHAKKIVPPLIHRWLTPRAMAVWYMDDGSIKSNQHRTVLLNTQGFGEQDVKRLQKALERRYGIKASVSADKDGNRLYIRSETVDVFLRTICPYLIPSMAYKIPKVWLTSLPKK